MRCSWPWADQPCHREPRNRFSVLCLIHLARLDELWNDVFARTPFPQSKN